MPDFIIENVPVRLESGLTMSEKVRSLATGYIRARLARPVVAWNDDELDRHGMGFASDSEIKNDLAAADYVSICLKNGFKNRIYVRGGLRPSEITQDDIDYAVKYLWFEPVFVAVWNDGQPYIDD